MQCTEPDVISVVYSGDIDASKEQIIAKVKARFEITLDPDTLHFVFLKSRWAVEDATWRHFTLLGQSLGSIYLAYEALSKLIPDLYIGESFGPLLHDLHLWERGRHHGLRLYPTCLCALVRCTCWCICALSYDQHRHARACTLP